MNATTEDPPKRSIAFSLYRQLAAICIKLALLALIPQCASAHQGPPFAIMVDKVAGPCVVSIWADPNVGIGKFYIILDPLQGQKLPNNISVQIGVQPVKPRLAEAVYKASRYHSNNAKVEYYVEVPFDTEERWKVQVAIQSERGGGDASTTVDVTPPGLSAAGSLIYLTPFLAVGILWIKGMRRVRALRQG